MILALSAQPNLSVHFHRFTFALIYLRNCMRNMRSLFQDCEYAVWKCRLVSLKCQNFLSPSAPTDGGSPLRIPIERVGQFDAILPATVRPFDPS